MNTAAKIDAYHAKRQELYTSVLGPVWEYIDSRELPQGDAVREAMLRNAEAKLHQVTKDALLRDEAAAYEAHLEATYGEEWLSEMEGAY